MVTVNKGPLTFHFLSIQLNWTYVLFDGESVVYLAGNTTGLLPHKKSFATWHRPLWCCGKFISVMAGSNQPGFELSFCCGFSHSR